MDRCLCVIEVQDFAGASQGIATTTLRAVVGDIPLDDVLAKVTEADGHREAAIKIVWPMEFTVWLRPLFEAGASPRGATGV